MNPADKFVDIINQFDDPVIHNRWYKKLVARYLSITSDYIDRHGNKRLPSDLYNLVYAPKATQQAAVNTIKIVGSNDRYHQLEVVFVDDTINRLRVCIPNSVLDLATERLLQQNSLREIDAVIYDKSLAFAQAIACAPTLSQ